MLTFFFEPKFIIFYIITNFILSIYIYYKCDKFFQPYILKKKDPINLHENYPEFRRNEEKQINFSRIFIGLIFMVWIKLILSIFFLILYYIYLK